MCSNCSGDDPKPESFALFDVSSPNGGDRFADAPAGKRKRYGTAGVFARSAKASLRLVIQGGRPSKWRVRIIECVDRGSFVNLNSGSSSGEYPAKSRIAQNTG